SISFIDRAFSITIVEPVIPNDPPIWLTFGTPMSLGLFNELTSVVIPLQAMDPDGGSLTFSVVAGTFPPGLTLNASTGVITGTISSVAMTTNFVFTIRAEDSGGAST